MIKPPSDMALADTVLRCRLEYRSRSGWLSLPTWAGFLMAVGAEASSFVSAQYRLVIVVSVPVRAFAACFVAAAAVTGCFMQDPPETDASRHFQYLASLAPGTPVTLRDGNSLRRGKLLGLDRIDGVDRIGVDLKSMIRRFPENLCMRIQPTDARAGTATSTNRLVRNPGFVQAACPALDLTTFSATARLECVIVGHRGSLQEELTAEQFRAKGHDHGEGMLQDLVRARYVAGANDTFRAALLPASADLGEKPPSALPPRVVIFDGSRALVNWRSRWEQSNWVVILDRSSPSAQDGAEVVAQAFAMRADDAPLPEAVQLPASMEAIAYLEAR